MGRFLVRYKPYHKPVSIVGEEAYRDYKETTKLKRFKSFKSYKDYRRVSRKIWKKVAEASLEQESGVYSKDFFYMVPQVVDNVPFITMGNGDIKTNSHTGGDIYSPIFCSLLRSFDLTCWSFDGCLVENYRKRLAEIIDEYVPDYFFILPTILKNK